MLKLHSIIIFALGTAAVQADTAVPAKIQFNRDVRPILSENCFYCHGNDASHRKAKLRLDIREEALKKEAFVPGNPDASELIKRIITNDSEDLMPPPDSHKKLSPEQKEILKRWIAQGVEYQNHWSYEKPLKAAIPEGANAVDTLVQKRLKEIGLASSPEADRRTLIRRLYADLLGLPPKHQEVTAFVKDQSTDAYGKLVERLLSSPHFGERMAIGWLDVVRFADTIGYHSDNPHNVWPYRDWVIKSFNDNKPFDRFTIEQLAGDLVPDASSETRVGSAFNRLILTTEEGGAQLKDYEQRMLADRVRALGTAWMGQTTGCAQCHDHKFDPFTARDFYSLGAFFADIKEKTVGPREQGEAFPTPAQKQRLAKLDADIREAKNQSKVSKPSQTEGEALAKLENERKSLEKSVPKVLVTTSGKKRVVRILPRGDWMNETGEIVTAALPHYLPQPSIKDRELTRLDLAKWLVSKDNPLTARTVMNRLWAQLFGIGLSKVPSDLGAQGELPPNQPLLDWLACEFMDSGWSMKHMVKTIVMSATYRQVSTTAPNLATADPYNRELARQSPFRLDAELVRDHALFISGLLAPTIGGASVKPYQPDGYWENLNFPTRSYDADTGEGQYRRGLYTWWQRSFLHPSLLAFDAPSREECTAERVRSNIPQQALVLLNDPTYVEAARAFAARILTECKGSTEERITWAWQQALQRNPSPEESKALADLVSQRISEYRANTKAAGELLKVGLSPVPAELDKPTLAAWSHVARILLNLHETITRT